MIYVCIYYVYILASHEQMWPETYNGFAVFPWLMPPPNGIFFYAEIGPPLFCTSLISW